MTSEPSPPITSAAPGTVLVCLDLQPVFLGAIDRSEIVKRRCQFAVSAAVALGIPVVFTEQVPQKLGATALDITALASSRKILGKTSFSALGDNEIRTALLEELGSEHLLLCGVETSVCVYQTAADALSAGLQVTILADAVGARRTDDHDTCLASLRAAGAHVLPAETVFYAILRDAGHSFFREYTKLVKKYG